jgi:ribosomal protein S6
MAKEKTTTELEIPASTRLYLVSALVSDEKELETLAALIKKHNAEIKKQESLGAKKLTYSINKHKELILISIFFTADGATVKTIEKAMEHEDGIERFILTKWDAEVDSNRKSRDSRKKDSDK